LSGFGQRVLASSLMKERGRGKLRFWNPIEIDGGKGRRKRQRRRLLTWRWAHGTTSRPRTQRGGQGSRGPPHGAVSSSSSTAAHHNGGGGMGQCGCDGGGDLCAAKRRRRSHAWDKDKEAPDGGDETGPLRVRGRASCGGGIPSAPRRCGPLLKNASPDGRMESVTNMDRMLVSVNGAFFRWYFTWPGSFNGVFRNGVFRNPCSFNAIQPICPFCKCLFIPKREEDIQVNLISCLMHVHISDFLPQTAEWTKVLKKHV
jgi:hypothetical protein